MRQKNTQVFISYSRADSDFALKLTRDLNSAEVSTWIDQHDVQTSAHWDEAIGEALNECEYLIIIMSPASVKSENVLDEINYAFKKGKKIIPVLYKECEIPFRLLRLQYIDFRPNYKDGILRLIREFAEPRSLSAKSHYSRHLIIIMSLLCFIALIIFFVAKFTANLRNPFKGDVSNMVFIPAGSFLMGKMDDEEGHEDEYPPVEIYVDAFYIDVTEVTVEQYEKFLRDNPGCVNPAHWGDQLKYPKRPVVYVRWNYIESYAKWVGKRLPTEAEWEYAARGGNTGVSGQPKYIYPWGNKIDSSKANYNFDSGRREQTWPDTEKYLKDVANYLPNGYGIYDMAGNVAEWCDDWYENWYYKAYYSEKPMRNPNVTKNTGTRVIRGGSWWEEAGYLRCASRRHDDPLDIGTVVGFRCAKNAQ